MERIVAVKKLSKMLGKGLGYRINTKAPDPTEREAAEAALPGALAFKRELIERKDARCKALLAADAEYQTLVADYQKAKDLVEKLSSVKHGRKITVGKSMGPFFRVMAEGDNWEEVIDKVKNGK